MMIIKFIYLVKCVTCYIKLQECILQFVLHMYGVYVVLLRDTQ